MMSGNEPIASFIKNMTFSRVFNEGITLHNNKQYLKCRWHEKESENMKKMTKEQMVETIRTNILELTARKHKGLRDRVNYTLKALEADAKSVTKPDVNDLLVEIEAEIAKVAPVENAEKVVPLKKVAPSKKKQAPSKKAPVKKTPKAKKEKVVKTEPQFPVSLEIEKLGKFAVVSAEVNSLDDLQKVFDEDRDLYFAFSWTPDDLKKFDYDVFKVNGNTKFKSFEHDLDLTALIYSTDRVAYTVSAYSEVGYCVLNKDMKLLKDGVSRSASGVRFAIYELLA